MAIYRTYAFALTDTLEVTLSGDLDATRTEELDECVARFLLGSATNATLDLTFVTTIDPVAMRYVSRLHVLARERGGRVSVVGGTPEVVSALTRSGQPVLIALPDARRGDTQVLPLRSDRVS